MILTKTVCSLYQYKELLAVFQLGLDHNFTISSTWVSTKENFVADRLSRHIAGNPRTEWSLDLIDFQTILNLLTWTPETDLFASHLNNKLPSYCSRARDPHSSWVDAFTLNCNGKKMLLFLSFQHYRKNVKETSKRQSRKHGHDRTSPSQQRVVSTVPMSVQSSSISTSSKHKQKVVSIYVTAVTT